MTTAGPAGAVTRHCYVVHPVTRDGEAATTRAAGARLSEAIGLAQAIALSVEHAEVLPLTRLRPATLLGSGAVARLAAMIEAREMSGDPPIDVVIVDHALTPIQQRNLERALETKVIDRSGLILEIFGARARTAEGELQVELASLVYQRSRLVRSWTHLERQRGGFGFLGGPGESQLETDRRLIGERIVKLKKELERVRRTRALHRNARRRVPYPVVALVGYTNAGKSTVFNRLTHADVFVKDQLFATLDPTMRLIRLPSGRRAILADTVGFISDLPHELIEAFRATLEEVTTADILLHVRDISHPDSEAQKADVEGVLAGLLAGDADAEDRPARPVIEVLNKADLLADDMLAQITTHLARLADPPVLISARTGANLAALLARIDRELGRGDDRIHLVVPPADGALLAWLYQHGEVIEREDRDDGIHVDVRMAPTLLGRLARRLERHGDAGGQEPAQDSLPAMGAH
ncbi:MAG: GTPase HflX [Rhodospirillales bacterium]|jgi:GTP-binding protein HflX|nr:GTPase HflX [Rhodospirillales bacterium]